MKKNLLFAIALFITMICYQNDIYSQSTTAGPALVGLANTAAPGPNYLGWALGVGLPLQIKNEDPLAINFHTNTLVAGGFNQRMTILGNLTP